MGWKSDDDDDDDDDGYGRGCIFSFFFLVFGAGNACGQFVGGVGFCVFLVFTILLVFLCGRVLGKGGQKVNEGREKKKRKKDSI